MDIPAEAVRQEKDIKSTQIGKEEVKLFADDVILYIENPKESIKTLLELINKFSTIAGYEIQKLLVFYTIVMNNPKIKLRKKKYKIYLIWKDICTLVYAALFTVAKILNQPKCSSSLQN